MTTNIAKVNGFTYRSGELWLWAQTWTVIKNPKNDTLIDERTFEGDQWMIWEEFRVTPGGKLCERNVEQAVMILTDDSRRPARKGTRTS